MSDRFTPILDRLFRFSGQLPYLFRAIGLIWSSSPGLMTVWLVMVLILGGLPALIVWLTKPLVDAVTAAVLSGGDWSVLRKVFFPAMAMVAAVLVKEVLWAINTWIRTAHSERVGEHIALLIHEQSTAVDLSFYDLPDYFDHLHRARNEAAQRPQALLESFGGIMRNSLTLAAIAGLLLPYAWWMPLLLVVGTLPAFLVVLHYTLRRHQWRLRITEDERRSWYCDWLLTSRENAAEVRLFDLGPLLREIYQRLRRRLRKGRLWLVRKEAAAGLGASAAGFLAAAVALLWMGGRVFHGIGTIGDLALFFQAFNRGQGLMRSFLEDLGRIYGNSLFLGDLFQFLELRPRITAPDRPKTMPSPGSGAGICFRNVSFYYPDRKQAILSGLNLEIPPGRIAAIVGPNGAGKSTLLKLLCRFYDPVSGHIEIDGVDLREMPLSAVRSRVSAVFQEPAHYSATAAQNIKLAEESQLDADIVGAAAAAGADGVIDRLPHGYETLLGTWFKGGTGLSVGEWQRLALARAFYRPSPVLLMDEPTSAMDPWAEAEWLRGLREAAGGRTVLIITHRLTTAMTADVIYVMNEGRVVESGSHDNLIAAGGAYAAFWRIQSRNAPLCT